MNKQEMRSKLEAVACNEAMLSFQIGATAIPYEIKKSSDAKRMRLKIDISTSRVDDVVCVVIPDGASNDSVSAFMRENEFWICLKWQELQNTPSIWPEHFSPGAKVFYNGRWEMIRERTLARETRIVLSAKGFIIEVSASENTNRDIKKAFKKFFSKPILQVLA